MCVPTVCVCFVIPPSVMCFHRFSCLCMCVFCVDVCVCVLCGCAFCSVVSFFVLLGLCALPPMFIRFVVMVCVFVVCWMCCSFFCVCILLMHVF